MVRDCMTPNLSTILIVEDDIQLAEVTCAVVELSGLQAVFRTSIAEAVDYLSRNPATTVGLLTDINLMTPMGGIELATYVAAEWPRVAICVTSGFSPERPARLPPKAIFLAKPWKPPELISFAEQAVVAHAAWQD